MATNLDYLVRSRKQTQSNLERQMMFTLEIHENQQFMEHIMKPEQELLIEVLKQAITDEDIEYMNSKAFENHCDLLGLEVDNVRELIMEELNS